MVQWRNIRRNNIEVVTIKRGGQATLHSPGQLVIYPVMDLLKWKIRPRDFLSLLEKITQNTLKKYGIIAEKKENSAGLFTQVGKIAFFWYSYFRWSQSAWPWPSMYAKRS